MSGFAYWLAWPQRLDPPVFWFFCGAALLAAVASFAGVFLFLRRARLIEDTPTSRLRSAAQGYVELEGEAAVLAGPPIVAPLTHTPCAWFQFRVEERESGGDRHQNGRWRVIARGRSDGLFLLRDDTGQCVVDPDGAMVTSSVTHVWYGNTPTPPPGMTGPRERRWFGTGAYRYREERIHPGDALYAIGDLRSAGGGVEGPTRAETVRDLLATWKRDRPRLLARFDRNGDGAIDPAEWEQARHAAEREAASELGRRLSEPGVLLLARPPDGRPFLLSSEPPARLTRRYQLYAAGLFSLFLLAGSAALWLINTRGG